MATAAQYWAVVPAAGSGSRMGQAIPKQYLPLAGQTVLGCTLDVLLACPWIAGVVVVLSADDTRFAAVPQAQHPCLYRAVGGAERAHSVLAGLDAVRARCDTPSATRVLVHDAARPGLTQDLLERLRDGDDVEHGALLALPAIDTLKQSAVAGAEVLGTVDRKTIWRAQTPQLFALDILHRALSTLPLAAITDEASAVEALGYRPRLVMGAERNLKITHPDDLALAAFWLQQT